MTIRKGASLFSMLAVALMAIYMLSADRLSAQTDQNDFNKMMEAYLATDEGQENIGQALQAYALRMREQAQKQQAEMAARDSEAQFKNPVQIPAGNSPTMGPEDAAVTIVEFSDFQCGFCKRGSDTMKELMAMYPDDVRLVFKNLPRQPQAMPAAKAALAAGKQGKFWEMHDALLNNQRSLGMDLFLAQAKELGLDIDQFKKDMESDSVNKQIQEDMKLAQQHNITGTPGFFVNGVAVRGAYPLEHFKGIVDRWLEKDA